MQKEKEKEKEQDLSGTFFGTSKRIVGPKTIVNHWEYHVYHEITTLQYCNYKRRQIIVSKVLLYSNLLLKALGSHMLRGLWHLKE